MGEAAQQERRAIVRRQADREMLEWAQKHGGPSSDASQRQRKLRRAIRHTCKAVLEHEMSHSAGGSNEWSTTRQQTKARVLDLSEGGTALFTKYALSTGQSTNLCIKLYDDQAIEAVGEVRWSKYKEKRDGYAIGFRFTHLDPANRKKLVTFLEELDGTLGMEPA